MVDRVRRTQDITDALNDGVLVSMRIRCWGASASLEVSEFSSDLPTDVVSAMQNLLTDKSYLEDLWALRDESKRFLSRYSFPHQIQGLVFAPKNAITILDSGFKTRREQFFEIVEMLAENLPLLEKKFANKYPKLYRPEKYPTKTQLKSLFTYDWCFRHLSLPDKGLQILSPELYEQELSKMKTEMRDMRDNILRMVGQQFVFKINSIKEQCAGGMVNSATIKSVNAFFERFDVLWGNFVGHETLKSYISEAKEILEGVDASMLKTSDDLRAMVGDKMGEILSGLSAVADARLHRRLDV